MVNDFHLTGSRRKLVIALIIAVMGFLLRLNIAANGPIEYDEPIYTQAAVDYAKAIHAGQWDGITSFKNTPEHPAFAKLVFGFGLLPFNKLFRQQEVIVGTRGTPIGLSPNYNKLLALRLISVVFGTLAVFFVSMINPLAGCFLAVDTFAVKYSSVIYIEALPAFFVLVAMLTFVPGMMRIDRDEKRRSAAILLLVSAAAVGISIASKYTYGVGLLALLAYTLSRKWTQPRKVYSMLAVWMLTCAVLFIIFDPTLWQAPVDRLLYSIRYHMSYSHYSDAVVRSAYPFWQPLLWLSLSIPQYPSDISPFFVLKGNFIIAIDRVIFCLAIAGLPGLYRRSRAFFWWLTIGFVFLLAWNAKWPQYVMLILPPLCLSAGHGAEWVWAILRKFAGPVYARWSQKTEP